MTGHVSVERGCAGRTAPRGESGRKLLLRLNHRPLLCAAFKSSAGCSPTGLGWWREIISAQVMGLLTPGRQKRSSALRGRARPSATDGWGAGRGDVGVSGHSQTPQSPNPMGQWPQCPPSTSSVTRESRYWAKRGFLPAGPTLLQCHKDEKAPRVPPQSHSWCPLLQRAEPPAGSFSSLRSVRALSIPTFLWCPRAFRRAEVKHLGGH